MRIRSPKSDLFRRKGRHDGRSPSGTSEPPSALSPAAHSSPSWASSAAAAPHAIRASAPTTSTGAAGWPPTCSASPHSGPPTVAATNASSSPRPRTRPAASTAALGSSQTPATSRRTASLRAKAALPPSSSQRVDSDDRATTQLICDGCAFLSMSDRRPSTDVTRFALDPPGLSSDEVGQASVSSLWNTLNHQCGCTS